MSHDQHGQPPERFYAERADARLIAEMIGICRGIIYDGVVTDTEAVGLANFIATHRTVASEFPGNEIARRLTQILQDGVIDEHERADLRALLEDLVGEPRSPADFAERSTAAAFDDPPPPLFFDGHTWVVTGRFAYGNRAIVEKAIADRGGRIAGAVSGWINYVLVGAFASPAWRQTQWGNKISAAVEMRAQGHKIAIVSERHWRETIAFDE